MVTVRAELEQKLEENSNISMEDMLIALSQCANFES